MDIAKFKAHGTSFNEEEVLMVLAVHAYEHGDHLGHATKTILINVLPSPSQRGFT